MTLSIAEGQTRVDFAARKVILSVLMERPDRFLPRFSAYRLEMGLGKFDRSIRRTNSSHWFWCAYSKGEMLTEAEAVAIWPMVSGDYPKGGNEHD